MRLNEILALRAAAESYIKDNPEIHLRTMAKALKEQGFTVSDQTIRRILLDHGMTTKGFGDKWLWGYWDDAKPVLPNPAEKPSPAQKPSKPSKASKPVTAPSDGLAVEASHANDALTNELSALQAAVQRTVELKKEIKSAQERLLVEIADLIKATYGQAETESPVEAVLRPSTASKDVQATVTKAEPKNASKGKPEPSTAIVEHMAVTSAREPETEDD